MEMLDYATSVWLHFFHLPPYTKKEKNHLNTALLFTFADVGNQTWAVCAASECAIHYSIGSRLNFFVSYRFKILYS